MEWTPLTNHATMTNMVNAQRTSSSDSTPENMRKQVARWSLTFFDSLHPHWTVWKMEDLWTVSKMENLWNHQIQWISTFVITKRGVSDQWKYCTSSPTTIINSRTTHSEWLGESLVSECHQRRYIPNVSNKENYSCTHNPHSYFGYVRTSHRHSCWGLGHRRMLF